MCIACHGADGKGNKALGAPNLTDNVWLYGGSAGIIAQSIAKGRTGVMPANRDFLGEDKVHLLSAYIYSLRPQSVHKPCVAWPGIIRSGSAFFILTIQNFTSYTLTTLILCILNSN